MSRLWSGILPGLAPYSGVTWAIPPFFDGLWLM
jgi:hypothetical protein